MSKAFTRESEDAPEPVLTRKPSSLLPPGAKNYMTPDGARRLREELERLVREERPRLAAGSDADLVKTQLAALDQRILSWEESLRTAEIVEPPSPPDDLIRFGATVTVRDGGGQEDTYRIVGVDEADVDRGWVSWLSPMAKALVKARRGQKIRLRLPGGETELEVLRVEY